MSDMVQFLRERIAEDDVTTRPKRWQVALRPIFFRIAPEFVLRNMAAHHADHPDYREEWKP